MILVDLAIVGLVLICVWVLGGLLLRLTGLALTLAGAAVIALTGDANGILAFAVGPLLWLAGHWLYAVRHLEFKSPLADFLFCRAPDWVDPARRRRTI